MSNTKPPLPALDYIPLAAFLAGYWAGGIRIATIAIMVATILVMLILWLRTRKIAMLHLFTAGIVGVTGGLTLWLKDDSFIKMKPTLIYLLFSGILAFGVLTRRPLLKIVLGAAMPLDETGWHRLAVRFLFFFLAMAISNEVVRRLLTTDQWVLWKVPGSLILTFLFTLSQIPLMRRHRAPEIVPDAAP